MRVFYLHGFASSARSTKAAFFSTKLAERGIPLEAPDLNEPDFGTLTVTRMIGQVLTAIGAGERVALIGSSLGGFVAVQVALQRPDLVSRLVLLAPALGFDGGPMRELGEAGLARWKASNALDIFHFGYGRLIPVHYELYADARRYDASTASLAMPVQVFQGRRDTVVDPVTVEQWALARPGVDLHLLDDDHQLLASLETIWGLMAPFLFGAGPYQQIP